MKDIGRDRLLAAHKAAKGEGDAGAFRRAVDQLAGALAINGLPATLLAVQATGNNTPEKRAATNLIGWLHTRLPLHNNQDAPSLNAAIGVLLETRGIKARFYEDEALSFLADLKLTAKACAKAAADKAPAGADANPEDSAGSGPAAESLS